MAFGDMSVPMLSGEEQEKLLEKEAELAKVRDEEARAFTEEQERMREGRERAQRMLLEQEEKARQTELRQQESEAAEVTQELEEEVDSDSAVASMFSALAYGTEGLPEDMEDTTDQRPE
tara:strand:- start:1128 stop:1484 length:357 start_codon:yes stop_codon:yes gene_type:complete